MKTTPKHGPRLPGGALTTARTAETKLGRCTVTRRVKRWTKSRVAAGEHHARGTVVAFKVDCGDYQTATIDARTYPQFQAEYAKQFGLDPKRPLWFIGAVDTEDRAQRKGLATRAYEALAAYVCSRGGILISNSRLHKAKSNDFWKKQIAKGRARIVKEPKGVPSFYAKTVALDCRRASDLSGGLGQLTTRTSRVVLAAKAAGYRVDAKGRVIAPSGRVRKTQTKRSAHGPYAYRTFSMKDGDHVVAVPVAHLAAAQKYGKRALRAGVEIRHLNDRSTDDRLANIAVGSRHANIMDSPKAKRVRIAKAGARASKRARRKR